MAGSPSVSPDRPEQRDHSAKPASDEIAVDLRLEPAEELARAQKLVAESNEIKSAANKLFATGGYSDAITRYNSAIASLPTYLDYELAVLHANISACHLKLQEWKEAVESATQSLDELNRLDPVPDPKPVGNAKEEAQDDASKEAVAEEVDDNTELRLESLAQHGHSLTDVRNMRTKALLRRAKARDSIDTWSSLQGAFEDYQQLSKGPPLSSTDAQTVAKALRGLGPRLDKAKERDMADMMDKLKGLGNGLLKPFGLSTDNFQFVKDEKTGGYSMNFNQGGK